MNRVVLVTGCSSGIGRATAEAFLARGWTVCATARDVDDVSALADAGCRVYSLDVTDEEQVSSVARRVRAEAGPIDCLVNNAGVVAVATVEEMSTDALRAMFDVNLFGPHRLVRAVVPRMRERGAGTVVNVGSVGGRFPVPAEGGYSASKFALRALTSALRDELRPFGVNVVLVEPPFVRTRQADAEMRAAAGREDSPYRPLYERFERYARNETASALDPSDVARVVADAAETDAPRARYPVGLAGRFQSSLGLLPAGVRYRLWTWAADR